MAIDPIRVKALFQAAIERDDPADRRTFLDREVGDDPAMRERLEVLLAEHDRPAGPLDRPLDADFLATSDIPGATGDFSPADPGRTAGEEPTRSRRDVEGPTPLDTVIAGRYKLRQEIGEGGMGSVYLAEQLQPVKRMVALKLIKTGMDTRNVLARFESERQALALMDHPHIAKVLDAGSTDQGRPFFVMELVKGIPITDYCDRHRLGLPERLEIFRQVCSAVQHAHQKGIIHRDLKPSNILVEAHDDRPVPKVIDFGLAKATSGMALTDQSLFTAFGTVAGTPLYMAPEQAAFNALDVDTRADIYALGVILYELLTGSTPIRRETFQRAALDEMLRVIREEEPPTPSSRLSTSDALPSLAANRHIEPTRLSRFVRGDLDWIVMKALAKERERRYDSAIGLANDLERFANHEPVSAGPPSSSYRFRKFVRRNRVQVIAASLVLVALVAGVVGTTLGLVEARRQEREARRQERIAIEAADEKEKARKAEAEQRRDAVTQRERAEKRLAQIEKANEILGSIFKNLDPGNAEKEGKPLSALLGERLDQATAAIEGEAIGEPLAVARMQLTLGESLLGLGYPEKAIGLFTRARATFTAQLGPDYPDTLTSMNNLAVAYGDAGQLDRALPLSEETLTLRKSKLGPDHPDTLLSMSNFALGYRAAGKLDRALPLLEEALALRRSRLGPDHPRTLASMVALAESYRATGKLDRALPLLEEALALQKSKLGPDHPDTLDSMDTLAGGYRATGELDRARPLMEETLALRKSRLGPDHPRTLISMSNLAGGYWAAGKLDRALPLWEETLALMKLKLGPDHPSTFSCMNSLALGYKAAGQLDRALPLYEETLALQKSKLGADHPDTLISMNNLAMGYQAAGQLDRALPLLEETLALRKSKLGADHPDTLISMANLADGYQAAGQLDRALPLLEETLALRKSKLGADHPDTLTSMNNLARGYWSAGRLDRSVPLFEEVLKLRMARSGADHPATWMVKANLGVNYKAAGRLGEALPLLEEAYRASGRIPTLNWVALQLLDAYVQAEQSDKAVALVGEQLERVRATLPVDSPQRAGQLASIGTSLLNLKAWTEAEPVVREALAIREVKEPDVWTTFNTRSQLGGVLLGQKKYAEAEPLLRAGYEGMKLRADRIPPQGKIRPVEALDRLIELAEATGKPDDAREWKGEKARLAPSTPKPEPEKR